MNSFLSALQDLQARQLDQQRDFMDAVKDSIRGGHGHSDDRAFDKVNALAGLEFKQTLPVLKASDTDVDKHWRQFQSILDCHAFGRKAVRPYDVLVVYRKCLPLGSIRLRIFNTCLERLGRRVGYLGKLLK